MLPFVFEVNLASASQKHVDPEFNIPVLGGEVKWQARFDKEDLRLWGTFPVFILKGTREESVHHFHIYVPNTVCPLLLFPDAKMGFKILKGLELGDEEYFDQDLFSLFISCAWNK